MHTLTSQRLIRVKVTRIIISNKSLTNKPHTVESENLKFLVFFCHIFLAKSSTITQVLAWKLARLTQRIVSYKQKALTAQSITTNKEPCSLESQLQPSSLAKDFKT